MFWFILLLILLGGGFYFYQRMISLEQEIRAEQEREKGLQQKESGGVTSAPPVAEEESPQPVEEPSLPPEGSDDGKQMLSFICAHPGVIQADLYAQLPQFSKKQAQQLLRELVEAGKVRRERQGSSFKLYPD